MPAEIKTAIEEGRVQRVQIAVRYGPPNDPTHEYDWSWTFWTATKVQWETMLDDVAERLCDKLSNRIGLLGK